MADLPVNCPLGALWRRSALTDRTRWMTSNKRALPGIPWAFSEGETARQDKMAATRKKGKFVGGSVPMGYDVRDKKLVVNFAEAEVIRKIFQRYVEIQSPKLIAMELNEQNIKTKQGKKWDTAHVNRILSNHTYVGEIKYKDAICKGEQPFYPERVL